MTKTARRTRLPAARLDDAELVVLSHLRWPWVWQRPQHLVSRLGRGRRTWFVEEPIATDVSAPILAVRDVGPVTQVWLEVPDDGGGPGYRFEWYEDYVPLLSELLGDRPRDVWLYAPMAIQVAEALRPRLLAYDVMDDLASFKDAPREMKLRTRRALDLADIVFAGGRSLHRNVVALRGSENTHLFPSGVECVHYVRSRKLRRPHRRPVAGYVGVIDERLDLDLIADLAARLPGWDIEMVGPVAKIDPGTLPQVDNIRYPGMQSYERLPEVMAGFDVALMPFALNDATRSISPTKTLEYLAAGLPVVSTRVADVVADWSDVVHLADTGAAFAEACTHVLEHSVSDRDARAAPLRERHEWDTIAAGMRRLLEQRLSVPTTVAPYPGEEDIA